MTRARLPMRRRGFRTRILALVAATAAGLTVGGTAVASDLTARSAYPPDWSIYHNYNAAIGYYCPDGPGKSSVPLRYGNGDFGLVHIEQGHGDFTENDSRATGYILQYGRPTYDSAAQKHTWRGAYAGERWVVVVSTRCESPRDGYVNGIITAYREG